MTTTITRRCTRENAKVSLTPSSGTTTLRTKPYMPSTRCRLLKMSTRRTNAWCQVCRSGRQQSETPVKITARQVGSRVTRLTSSSKKTLDLPTFRSMVAKTLSRMTSAPLELTEPLSYGLMAATRPKQETWTARVCRRRVTGKITRAICNLISTRK